MNNILIIGNSSGIGQALTKQLNHTHVVYGTYFKQIPNPDNKNIHYLNVLDDNLNVDFLPNQLHGLVYCPGSIQLKPFTRFKEEDFINDYKLQVTGAIKVIQACLPRLKNSQGASVILFSTIAVKLGFNFHSLVAASKGAVEGLTKSLAAEFAPIIRVNCIAPSITNTPLASHLLNSPEKIEANAQKHPLKKIGDPEDIAGLAAYLLNPTSQWITGQIFNIDGGLSSIKI